jgi:histone H3/H4
MEDYTRQIGRLAVAQLCQIFGFSSISSQALDTLEEVLHLLIEKIGERAHLIAELSNRTECNILDVFSALEVIQSSQVAVSSYLSQSSDFAFARPVAFPENKPAASVVKPISYEDNIPSFLPRFPPSHTYMFTAVPITRNMDAATLRAIKIKEKKEIEERLAGIIGGQSMQLDVPVTNRNPYINLGLTKEVKHIFDN